MRKTIAIMSTLFALDAGALALSTPANAAGATRSSARQMQMRHAVKHRTMRSGGGKMPASKNF